MACQSVNIGVTMYSGPSRHQKFTRAPKSSSDSNVMPPQARDVDRVARLQLGHPSVLHRVNEPRMRIKVRYVEIHQADRLARQGIVQRTDVQVGHLIRRKQGEATASSHDAGDVLGQVPVRGRDRPVAEPQGHQTLPGRIQQRHRVGLGETRQMAWDRDGSGIHVVASAPAQPIEQLRQWQLNALEVEALQIRRIEETPAHGRVTDKGIDRPGCLVATQIARQIRRASHGPPSREPTHHDRLSRRHNLRFEAGTVDAVDHGQGCGSGDHRRTLSVATHKVTREKVIDLVWAIAPRPGLGYLACLPETWPSG